jgi:hypothetical protein
MLWKSLRWNFVNVSAIVAFCALPLIGPAIGLSSGNSSLAKISTTALLAQLHDCDGAAPCSTSE